MLQGFGLETSRGRVWPHVFSCCERKDLMTSSAVGDQVSCQTGSHINTKYIQFIAQLVTQLITANTSNKKNTTVDASEIRKEPVEVGGLSQRFVTGFITNITGGEGAEIGAAMNSREPKSARGLTRK